MRQVRAGLLVSLKGVTETSNMWQIAFAESMGQSLDRLEAHLSTHMHKGEEA